MKRYDSTGGYPRKVNLFNAPGIVRHQEDQINDLYSWISVIQREIANLKANKE